MVFPFSSSCKLQKKRFFQPHSNNWGNRNANHSHRLDSTFQKSTNSKRNEFYQCYHKKQGAGICFRLLVQRNQRSKTFLERVYCLSFLAFFSNLFSFKVFTGSFLSFFRVSIPFAMTIKFIDYYSNNKHLLYKTIRIDNQIVSVQNYHFLEKTTAFTRQFFHSNVHQRLFLTTWLNF